MKQKIEKVIRNKKVTIALMECAVAIGCIVIFCLFMIPKDRIPDTTHSYSKVEKVMKYKVVDNYMTRVMPLTDYKTFKEIAENTLNNGAEGKNYTVKVYSDAEKTKEVTSGYIASGMIAEAEREVAKTTEVVGETAEVTEEKSTGAVVDNEEKETELVVESGEEKLESGTEEGNNNTKEEVKGNEESKVEEDKEIVSYRISVIGDMTKDGDINVTELTKITKCVIGLSNWKFSEEEKLASDLNGDGQIDITDIESCINYIVFGELDIQEEKYTVTFKDYDGSIISTKTNYHYGDKIEVPDAPKREADENYSYEFAGWSPEISETEKVTGNAEYIATYRMLANRAKYAIEYYKEKLDGSYELVETEELTGETDSKVTATAKEYIGFTEDTENEERVAEGTIVGDGSLVLKLFYKRNEYTLTLEKDENIESVTGAGTYKYGATVSINATLKEEVGYEIRWNKWTSSNTELLSDQADKETNITMPTGELTLTATTTKESKTDTVYKVEHYKEKLDGSYELAETENLTGETDSKATATVKEYTGFTEDTENEERVAEGIIAGDGSLVLKLFYKRNEYTLTLEKDENIESVTGAGTYKYGATVSINATLKEEVGYEIRWNKWTSSNTELLSDQADKETNITMPAGELTLTATTTKEVKTDTVYKVEHYKEKLDGTYELAETEELIGTTGEEVTALAKTYEGFTEDTENEERIAEGTIAGDGSLVLKLFYNRNEYTIIFKDYNGTELSKVNYKYEERINIPDNPTREADETYTYEFLGWNPEVTEIVTDNVEYTAQYTETYIEYSITFKDYDETIISSKTDYHYGDTIELPESPIREADDDYEYEFAGWDKEVIKVTKDEVYTATYDAISYKILITRQDGTTKEYISFEKAFQDIQDEQLTIQLIEDMIESIIVPENKNITIDLNNHKINSNEETTIINNGNVVIVDNSIEKGGMIENTSNSVVINNGNLTLGYDDGVVEENILIKGKENAIQNNNNFYMYDGTLMGKTTITGNNAIIPEGEEYGISIREEDGIQIATIQIIEIPQALVGETYYMTLQEAINDNNEETIYVVKKNIELIDVITIDATKNLTIDLNGNNITKSNATGYVIDNAGTLTIKNTNESNIGTIDNTVGSTIHNSGNLTMQSININSYSYGVYNQKDLTIQDVDIESSNSYGVCNADPSNNINFTMLRGSIIGYSGVINSKDIGSDSTGNISVKLTDTIVEGKSNYSIYNSTNNSSEITEELTNVTVKFRNTGISNHGSNISMKLKDSIVQTNSETSNSSYGIYCSEGFGDIVLENTIINIDKSSSSGSAYGINNSSTGDYNITIDKNTQIIVNTKSSSSYGICSDNSYSNKLKSNSIKLLDGNILATSENGKYGYGVYLNSSNFGFLGGNISATIKTIEASIGTIAEGKQIQTVYDEDKYISTLVDSQHTEYVASIGEEKYYSLKEAIAACESVGEATTITMLSDYEQWGNLEIANEKNIILDLNGHKITTYSEFVNEGELEVKDSSEEKTGIIEEKTGRAILNKGDAVFTLNGGKILLNSETLSKCAIYNMDQANIKIKQGTIEINDSKAWVNYQYIIYNVSTGNIEITEGKLKGSCKASLYGIYNYVDDIGGDRNINISDSTIDILSTDSTAWGMYNYAYHSSNVTDTSRDTINVQINNSNIDIKTRDSSSTYGIYNYAYYTRDSINFNLQNSTVKVTNSYYYGRDVYGIYNTNTNSGSVIYNNIDGGSIKATGSKANGYGIYNSGNNIIANIGIQGEETSKKEPSILGETCGINSINSNTINFFQGIIKGASAISDATVLSLEEGKELNRYVDETDGYDTIEIQNKTPEAQIGTTQYMTLQEAIDACQDDATESTTIELTKEINNATTTVTVGEKKKVTLDLKGYNFISLAEHTIVSNGDLNIIDSEGTGSIKNNSKIAIGNYGNLTINTISVYGKTTGIANYKNANAELNEVNIDASSTGINNAGNINLNSSTITMTVGTYGVYNIGSMNIISSNISIKYGNNSTYGICNSGNVLNIKNSNITSEETNSYYSYKGYAIYVYSGIVNISDKESGEEDTTIISSSHIGISKSTNYASTKINYYGGKIVAKEKLLDGGLDEILEGKEILLSEEDSKKVATLVDKQEGNVVKIRDTEYESIEKAISYIPEESEEQTEIQLISDIKINCSNERINIPKEKNIKLDLNGYEIVSYDLYAISNKGKFEIIDTSLDKTGKIISEFNTAINNNGELTINGGYINAKRSGISNSNNGTIIMNSGTIDIEANESKGISAISSNTGTVNLYGGNINVTKEKGPGGSFTYDIYAAGIYVSGANLTIDGTNISLTNNQSGAYTYGIRTYNSKINYESGTMYVESTYYGSAYGIFGYRYNSGSSIEINGGSIEVVNAIQYGYGIRLESESGTNKVYMTGGKLKTNGISSSGGSSGGIYCLINNDNCGVNITGGTIEATGTSGGTAISGSNITIGVKDGNMTKIEPVIEGKTYGISGRNLKFYDGTIRGGTALTQSPVDVEAGYKVSIASSGELQSATLTLVSTAEAIAQIGNLYFNDLQQAINACSQTDTINILTAIKCNQTLTIEEGKTVTIDLMGNTLNANGIDNIIANYGTLTIIDSVGGGSINGQIDNHGQLNQ